MGQEETQQLWRSYRAKPDDKALRDRLSRPTSGQPERCGVALVR